MHAAHHTRSPVRVRALLAKRGQPYGYGATGPGDPWDVLDVAALPGVVASDNGAPARTRPAVQLATHDALMRQLRRVTFPYYGVFAVCVVAIVSFPSASRALIAVATAIAIIGGLLLFSSLRRFATAGLVIEHDALIVRTNAGDYRFRRRTARFDVQRRGRSTFVTVSDGVSDPVAVPGLLRRLGGKPTKIVVRSSPESVWWLDTPATWDGHPEQFASLVASAESLAP